jgi:TonB family protein
MSVRAPILCLFFAVCVASVCPAQETGSIDNSVVARLDAAVSPDGVLEGSMVVTAKGASRAAYRDAFRKNPSAFATSGLFGRFVQIRQIGSTPVLTGVYGSDGPLEIRFRIRENDFLLPIQRQILLQLDLLSLDSAFSPAPGATPRRFREEITLTLPPGFSARASHTNESREFAQYQSDANVEHGRLVVVRELRFGPPATGVSQSELESLRESVRKDQQQTFTLRRTSRADATSWIESVSPVQANSYCILAYQQRQYEAARKLCERAIQFRANDLSAWNNLGRALAALGDWDAAQKAYRRQIAINPADHYAYNNLGLAQERVGDWDGAIESLRKQIEVHPGDTYAIANLPRALVHERRWAEVETAASKALEVQPNNTQQKLYLSAAHVCQGKASDARLEIGNAMGARPAAVLLNNAAYYLSECGKEEELAESYGRKALDQAEAGNLPADGRSMSAAIASQSSLSTYLDTYGWVLFKRGKVQQAEGLLLASATLAPRADAYEHLAQVESKLGHADLAGRYWREATIIEPARISQVPPEIAARLESVPALSIDRAWFPLESGSLWEVASEPNSGQPSYFFVRTSADGSAEFARELDTEDQTATKILPAVRAISFPMVEADGRRFPTVHVVRVVKGADGKVLAARSVAPEAVAIASELVPGEFPLPAVPAPPSPVPTTASNSSSTGGTPPRILRNNVPPRYTEEARIAMLTGTVLLSIVVGTDGMARDFQVVRSLGLGLDESAIRAVSAWEFVPGTKDGKPVQVASTVEVNFVLGQAPNSNGPKWHLGRVQFTASPGATRPAVAKTAAPYVSSQGTKASVTVTFDIDERGAAVNPRVVETSDVEWSRDVLAALGKWKFGPALRDGQPVLTSCTMDFVRGN